MIEIKGKVNTAICYATVVEGEAIEQIRRALDLEPSNMEYRQFQQQLQFGGDWYQTMGSSYERPYSGYSNFCMSLLCMQALCTCCCRPF